MRKQPLSGLAGTALKQGVLLLAVYLVLGIAFYFLP